jgi:hypothetical protein
VDSIQVRQLPVGRTLKISKTQSSFSEILIDDSSIAIFAGASSLLNIPLDDVSRESDEKLSIKCIDEAPVNF